MATCVPEAGTLTGVMGGMFDPVHLGHLQAAAAARTACSLERVLLLPCGNPVHRGTAFSSASHRCAMLRKAITGLPWLQLDARECDSEAPSRTYDSLLALKTERPAETLCFILGLDAFLSLASWYRWRELFTLAQLVVITRPGYRLPAEPAVADPVLAELAARRCTDAAELAASTAGRILLLEAATPALSSSQVRAGLLAGQPVAELLPAGVADYVTEHDLYRQA
jgi:nicotinate-nucleotide adenylyltransferase